jgi:Plasmid pRiA4b ORF-3-like protein
VLYDREGRTLTVWFSDRHQEHVCEEAGEEVVLMKDAAGRVIGFEKFNYSIRDTDRLRVRCRNDARVRECQGKVSRELLIEKNANPPGWEIPITRHFVRPGTTVPYEYDFGDGWEHELTLEAIVPRQEGQKYPLCVDGARACPLEDCGGVYGYETLLT